MEEKYGKILFQVHCPICAADDTVDQVIDFGSVAEFQVTHVKPGSMKNARNSESPALAALASAHVRLPRVRSAVHNGEKAKAVLPCFQEKT